MAVYNVNKIEDWYDDFVSLRNKFKNTYYSDYKSCYVNKCSDSIVNKMETKLDAHYEKIERIYTRINTFWKNYLNDLKNTDACLAGTKSSGSVNAAAVSSKLKALPNLDEYKADLDVRVKSVSGVVGVNKGIGWAEDRTIEENLAYFGERVGATITTLGVSLTEGLVKLVESGVDLIALAGTVVASEYTMVIDNASFLASEITGDESIKTNYTEMLWEETRAFVSEDYTGMLYDSFYENTTAGQWMKENAYGFETVREIGAEVGEVIGVIALSTVTGGSAAVIYGTAKTAEHTEENWQDENTSTAEGLIKGIFEGTADGVFFSIGMKGDAAAKSAATTVVKKATEQGGKTILKKIGILETKMLFEAATSIVQDGTNMVIDALFMEDTSFVDEKGNTVELNDFLSKLNYCYEQAGGVQTLLTSAGTAFILSGLSDTVDVFGAAKNANIDSAIKNTDINSSNIGKKVDNISVNNIDAFEIHGSLDEQIAKTNRYIEKGGSVTLYVNSVDDIPTNVWENIKRPNIDDTNVAIITKNGEKFYWGEPIDAHMLKSTSSIGEQVDDINIKNVNDKNIYTSQQKTQMWTEYNDMLDKWGDDFDYYKELYYNNGAGDLNKITEFHNDFRRIMDIEDKLGLTGTKSSVATPTKKWTSIDKESADSLAEQIRQKDIPIMEKYKVDTNSKEYKEAMREIYSSSSPSGKVVLDNIDDVVALGGISVTANLTKSMRILDEFGANNGVNNYGRKALEEYARTGSVMQNKNGKINSYITNKDGVRDFISSLEPREVKEYLDFDNKMKNSIKTLDEFGANNGVNNYGRKALEEYARTGSVMQNKNGKINSYITNKDGVRDFISSLDPRTVSEYLGMDNIGVNTFSNTPNSSVINHNSINIVEQEASNIFKNTNFISDNYSEQQINHALIDNIHTYASEEDFLKAYGHYWDGVLQGFNRGNEVHINPNYDTPHTRIHEALHNITSEFDSNGKKIVTGFEYFDKVRAGDYSNGDLLFNEGATDYLTHKIVGDGCHSNLYLHSFNFWKGLDEILQTKYGDNNIIFEAYKKHDVTSIKEFMDYYGGTGTFDKIKNMTYVDTRKAMQVLDEVRAGVNKELNPSVAKKVSSKLKNIFGG